MQKIIILFSLLTFAACDIASIDASDGDDGKGEEKKDPPRIRQLGRKALLGDTPIDNRIVDPLLTFTTSAMFAFVNDGSAYPETSRRIDGRSPTRTPYVQMDPREGPGTSLFLTAKTATTPEVASVWLGRESGNFDDVDSTFFGVFLAGASEGGEPLLPVAGSKQEKDGITWVRFEARLNAGPIGFGQLMVSATESDSLFITAPAVVDDKTPQFSARIPHLRPATAQERMLLAMANSHRLGMAPHKAPPSPFPQPLQLTRR